MKRPASCATEEQPPWRLLADPVPARTPRHSSSRLHHGRYGLWKPQAAVRSGRLASLKNCNRRKKRLDSGPASTPIAPRDRPVNTQDRFELSDPLKQLSEISQPDERQAFLAQSLEQIHAHLSALILHDRVPGGVRQLFETAKNARLYTYYVYRFHQLAEMTAYLALERALKERWNSEFGGLPSIDDEDFDAPGLAELLNMAAARGRACICSAKRAGTCTSVAATKFAGASAGTAGSVPNTPWILSRFG